MRSVTPVRNVLIVEDNLDFASLLRRLLEEAGITCELASSGGEALSRVTAGPIDLMLLDFRLPDMDAFELLTTLAQQGRAVPFVVVTGLGDHQVAVRMMKHGALDYVVKDGSLLDLLPSVIEQAFSRLDRDRRLAEAERKLREQNLFFQNVLDSVSHPLYVINATTGCVEMANRAARTSGRDACSLPHGGPLAGAVSTLEGSPIAEVRRTRKPLTIDHVDYDPHGAANIHEVHIYPVLDETGEVSQVVEYELDVTTRKRAEQALRDSEARLRQVVESLPIIVLSRDVTTRRLVLLIGPVEEVLGYDRRQFEEDPDLLIKMVHHEDFERVRHDVVRSLDPPQSFRSEFRIVHGHSGQSVWVRAHGTPILDEDGTLLRLDSVILDITAERQAAQDREAFSQRLQQAQRLESLGVLAGGIAHDFSNLLTIISGNIQFLHESARHDAAESKALADVESAIRNAIDMTRSLQAFSKPGTPQFVRSDANAIIQDVYRFLRRLIPARIEFQFRPSPVPCLIDADPAQMQQVLINLCINSRDAMGAQGRLELRTRTVPAEQLPERIRGENREPRYVEIAVGDSGTGMDDQTLRRAFDPFFTTKPKDQGTGLGLAMVYRIIEAHGGFVDVTSERGRGTEVRVYLPHAPSQAGPEPSLPQSTPRGTERVLVVDDEEMIAGLIKTLLEGAGYAVTVAHHPDEAIGLARADGPGFDLAVIDYGLPGMGGDKCLLALRRHRPGLRALLITGYQVSEAELALEDMRILQKPFSARAITEAVREALDQPGSAG